MTPNIVRYAVLWLRPVAFLPVGVKVEIIILLLAAHPIKFILQQFHDLLLIVLEDLCHDLVIVSFQFLILLFAARLLTLSVSRSLAFM